MKIVRKLISFMLISAFAINAVLACGPGYVEPVFMFERSPDIPFEEFTGGNIGIIRPTFGPKSLVIAYRYLNGGGYNSAEQKQLIDALKGTQPENNEEAEAVDAWLEARKQILPDEKSSAIYTERAAFGGYNFFPNCTANAFEVATKTLNERLQSHGADNRYVREWLEGQDRVFEICSSGATYPSDITPDMPDWLKKDRAYQIAAAYFYALKFDEARGRFERIAEDGDSPWRETADYLVGRTLVRQGSLIKDAAKQRIAYEQAEQRLDLVLRGGGRFGNAAEQLLNLVKYRIRPKERMAELSRTLSFAAGNQNLRQDMIDFVWLFDKFEAEAAAAIEEKKKKQREEEQARKAAAEGEPVKPDLTEAAVSGIPRWLEERDSIQKGETIRISLTYKVPGEEYPEYASNSFPFDAVDEQIIKTFSDQVGRKLTEDEIKLIKESTKKALEERTYYLSANYRYSSGRSGHYEGNRYSDTELTTEAIPQFLRGEDLTDWMITFQVEDDLAYRRSLEKLKETRSDAWLIAALAKAKKDSPEVEKLIADGKKIGRSSNAFPTVVYHIARLAIEQGKDAEASKMLDDLIGAGLSEFPVSTSNMLLDLRMRVAKTLDEFLRFAGKMPVTFDKSDYQYGTLRDFMETEKGYWSKEHSKESQEEFIQNVEREYASILPWDGRVLFDDKTVDIFNKHFSIDLLAQAALSKELPEHLRGDMALTVWTRAVLLGRGDLTLKFASEAAASVPEMAETFKKYLAIKAPIARRNEELWILVKNPRLSAYVTGGVPERGENEIGSWDDGWWFEPSDTYYGNRGDELPKSIAKPVFVTARQSADARSEKMRIFADGDAESYLSKRVFAWAAASPRDPRVPEALSIIAVINVSTKYGNGNSDHRDRAIKLLETRYPNSPWIAKAKDEGF